MNIDCTLCATCIYCCVPFLQPVVVSVYQRQWSDKSSNNCLVPRFNKTALLTRNLTKRSYRRCILFCRLPEKKENQETFLSELWKLGWSLGKLFSIVSSSDKFLTESAETQLDRVAGNQKETQGALRSFQEENTQHLEKEQFLQLNPTPTALNTQTLEIILLALNNSKNTARRGVDSVLPYEVQRELFDSFCKGSSLAPKSSQLTKSGRVADTNDSERRLSSIALRKLNDSSSSKHGNTVKSDVEDPSSIQNGGNLKIGVQKRSEELPGKNLNVSKDRTNENSIANQLQTASVSKVSTSVPGDSNSLDRHLESLIESSLRFFSSLASSWNPLSKANNVENVLGSSQIEQHDSINSQPVPKTGSASEESNRTAPDETSGVQKKDISTWDLIKAANAVRWKEDAAKFVDKDKIGQLIHALTEDSEETQAEAATALANLAAVLPSTRSLMLEYEDNKVCQFAKSIICEGATRSVMRFRWKRPYRTSLNQTGRQIEVKMSILHLVGSLALCFEPEGRKWRKQACEDKEFVAALKRFSRGASGGYSEGVARCARRALACLGINSWTPRVPGQKGIRVLSFDGGGTRAIMTFEILKYLKRITGCEIHELFDVIGGTSTGGIIAVTIGLRKRPIEEVEALYRELIGKIFTKTPVNTPKLLITRSYYDASILEGILKREAGRSLFIDSVTEENANKVFVVSSIVSRKPHVMHLFRNYTFMEGKESRYEGSVEAQLWEGLRASSAAPTYFSEMRINGELYADGALVANNPTGVAIHETKKLFPNVPLELVVSIGTGRLTSPDLPEATRRKESSLGWNDIITYLINSATSTENIHESLEDLLPPDKYFRLNPMTDSVDIDEVRPGKLAKMTELAQQYIRENEERLELLGELLRPKPAKALHELLLDLFRVRGFYVDSFYQIGDDWYFPENF
ncbi:hypothetical protein GAYE_SCF05G2549 [Galdieria yellowstonensis]|uniref:PNPLA domain-containing protein n=1 Tax=Galdieria yellowstonensis TaxID=3028027 RepID=A0AAV9IBA1_9RHOD|nr:hypothetical protein GAYE_SCF05G2549 [Galdieria yellowstonensis]